MLAIPGLPDGDRDRRPARAWSPPDHDRDRDRLTCRSSPASCEAPCSPSAGTTLSSLHDRSVCAVGRFSSRTFCRTPSRRSSWPATLALATAIIDAAGLGLPRSRAAGSGNAGMGYDAHRHRALPADRPDARIYPGIAIVLSVLGFNLVGDGLARRSTRSCGRSGRIPRPHCSSVEGLQVELDRPRHVRAVDGSPSRSRRADAGHRRRVRLRQERHRALGAPALPPAGRVRRADPFEGRDSSPPRTGAAGDPRQPDRDDVPGPDDVPQPGLTVGRQIPEPLRTHRGLSREAARARAVEMLRQVGIPARGAATTTRTSSPAGCASA